MSEEEAYKIFSEMTPDVLDYVFCLAKAYTEKDKEIERQKEIIRQLDIKNLELTSIIKEVREYIEKHIAMFKNGNILVDMNIDELLEILDKVDKEKEE